MHGYIKANCARKCDEFHHRYNFIYFIVAMNNFLTNYLLYDGSGVAQLAELVAFLLVLSTILSSLV